MKSAFKENENLVSTLTDGKVENVEFGGNIKEIGFNAEEFIAHYNKPEVLKKAEYYRKKMNKERAKNGLPPI